MSETTTSQVDLPTLARLAGFESSSSNETQTIQLSNENQTPQQPTEINEEINLQISIEENAEDDSSPLIPPEELEEEVTIDQWSFTPNRINKVALFVGAGIISLLVGFFTTFNQQATTEPDEPIASEVRPLTDELETDPTAERLGEAQTDLALGEQQRQLQQLNQSQVKPPRPKKTTSPPPPKPVQPIPPPVNVATPPPPRPPRRSPRPVAVRPMSRPVPPPVSRPNPTPVAPPLAVKEEPEVDPQTAWLAAATAGTMGGSSHQTVSRSTPTQPTYTGTDDPIALASLQTNNLVTASDPNLEAPILEGRPRDVEVIPANTRIRGVLLEAIAWDDPRLVVEAPVRIALTEALVSENGKELLPPGTEIMAMVQQARPSGLVMLTATGIEYPTETEYRSVPVDPSTISIKLTDGMPLMAQRMQQGGQQPGVDAGGLMLDVLGTVAPMISGGSGNPYRDMYQINQVQQVYSRHFSQRNNYYTPQPQNFWLLPRDLEVELIIRQPIRIFEDNYDY